MSISHSFLCSGRELPRACVLDLNTRHPHNSTDYVRSRVSTESNRCVISGTLSRTGFASELVNPTVASFHRSDLVFTIAPLRQLMWVNTVVSKEKETTAPGNLPARRYVEVRAT